MVRNDGPEMADDSGSAGRRATTFRVRRGRSYDLNAVVELYDGCGLVASPGGFRNELERKLISDPDLFLVAVDTAGDIIGALSAGFDGRMVAVSRIATQADRRRQGVATALVTHMHTVLERLGAADMAMVVIDDTDDSRRLWDALGYEQVRRVPLYQQP